MRLRKGMVMVHGHDFVDTLWTPWSGSTACAAAITARVSYGKVIVATALPGSSTAGLDTTRSVIYKTPMNVSPINVYIYWFPSLCSPSALALRALTSAMKSASTFRPVLAEHT